MENRVNKICAAMLLAFLLTASITDIMILFVLPEVPQEPSKAAYFMQLFDPLPVNFSVALAAVAAALAGIGRAIMLIVEQPADQDGTGTGERTYDHLQCESRFMMSRRGRLYTPFG